MAVVGVVPPGIQSKVVLRRRIPIDQNAGSTPRSRLANRRAHCPTFLRHLSQRRISQRMRVSIPTPHTADRPSYRPEGPFHEPVPTRATHKKRACAFLRMSRSEPRVFVVWFTPCSSLHFCFTCHPCSPPNSRPTISG